MSRLLFFLAVAIVVYLLLKSYRNQETKLGVPSRPEDKSEDMVRCVQCGVHLPRSESILSGGSFYCCEEHRRIHAAR